MSGVDASRRRLIVANWKMCLGREEALAWVDVTLSLGPASAAVAVGVAPSFVVLHDVAVRARDSGIQILAQDCHPAASGAHTGAVSLTMLREAGASGVLIGHSERRREFGESDSLVRAKLGAALDAGFAAILCVGETWDQREAGRTESVLESQLERALEGLEVPGSGDLVVAYEPVWAIGTGRTASVPQAVAAMAFIRTKLERKLGASGGTVPLLYGGSVTRENAGSLFAAASIDGALVGGASLDPRHFADIVRAVPA